MGVGYEWNSWLRFDVTGEYRTKAAFKATGRYTDFCAGGGNCFDVNTGNFSSAVFLANAYVDLGTWWCLTPFIGVGVGGACNMISWRAGSRHQSTARAPASVSRSTTAPPGAWLGTCKPA